MENVAKIRWLEVEMAALRKLLERHLTTKHSHGDAI